MVSLNQLVAVCLLYVVGLFAVAFAAERAAARGRGDWLLRSPLVYTLSLSIYCPAPFTAPLAMPRGRGWSL